MSESPHGPRSKQPTDYSNRGEDRGRYEVIFDVGQPVDTVADVNDKRYQEYRSDEPAELAHIPEGTAMRTPFQEFDREGSPLAWVSVPE